MTHITTDRDDMGLSAPKFGNFDPLLKFLADGVRDMNRYLNAASLVPSADRPGPVISREQSWEGSL